MRGSEPSHSQMNFHCGSWSLKWTLKFSESNCKGQNPSVQRFFYIIGKILKHRCLKWVCMTHLDIWNTNYGQKKGRKSNWQFDSRPLKVENRPDFLACRWLATYCWKALDKGYNFALDIITIRGLHTNLCKVARGPTLGISGVPGQNAIWMWASWKGTKYTIRGKVVATPKFGPWWILWVWVFLWFVLAQKMLKLCINQLVWFV